MLGIERAGALGALAPALVLGAVILLRYPATAFALLVGLVVVVEPIDPGLVPLGPQLYETIGHVLTPIDVILYLGLAGLLVRFAVDGRRPDSPRPLNFVFFLLGCAIAAGVLTAYTANAGVPNGELYHRGLTIAYPALVAFLAVNVLRDARALKAVMVAAAALAAYKGVSGLYTVFRGGGLELEGETVTYLEPAANLMMMIFLLGITAAAIRRVELPGWMIAAAPVVFLALLFSYRRSFWVGTALGLIAVAFIASRQRGRALYALAIVAAICGLAVGAATVSGSENLALTQRISSLDPTSEDTNRGDEYRRDERKNVLANIAEQPLTGVGLGVGWKVHYPTIEVHPRNYVHFAFLYFWLELGPIGALAYVGLIVGGLWLAARIWRRHPDPLIQVGAIAVFATFLAAAVIELTATFTGVEARWSIMIGVLLGWLVAAHRQLPSQERASSLETPQV